MMILFLFFLGTLFQISNSFITTPLRIRIANSMSMSTVVGAELTNARSFLQILLSSKSKMEDKASLVSALQGLRAKESDGTVNRVEDKSKPAVWNGDKAAFLDSILSEMDSIKGIFGWPNAQFLSFLPSYRVKVVALKRMMSLITSEEVEQIAAAKVLLKEDNVEQALAALKQTRQRRALSVIIGQLQSQPEGIRGLEKEARSRIVQQTTMAEMLDRTPKGLETPSYDVVYSNPAQTWEVRKYNDFSVVSMVMDGTQSQGPGGFNSLAGYIFGKNTASEKMAMTTPVISYQETDGSEKKKMSFVMPSRYWQQSSLASAPAPVDGGVKVEPFAVAGGQLLAACWFGGYCTQADVEKRVTEMRKRINEDGSWEVVGGITQTPLVLQYNDPFQPPWKRRNEVCLVVIKK